MENNNSNEENPVTPRPTRRQVEAQKIRVEMNGSFLAPARPGTFFSLERDNLITVKTNQRLSRITEEQNNNPTAPIANI